MKIQHFALSIKGSKHSNNEDYYTLPVNRKVKVFDCLDITEKGLLYIICDGIGGHNAGDVASKMAASITAKAYQKNTNSIDYRHIISSVNRCIYNKNLTHNELSGMGTTFIALLIKKNNVEIYNVGDSRAYFHSQRKLQQISEDHSYVWGKYKEGLISKNDILKDPQKNLITRAIGISPSVEIDTFNIKIPQSDFIFLLCSDGLTDYVTDDQIEKVINKDLIIERTAYQLQELALEYGSQDDITLILIKGYLS